VNRSKRSALRAEIGDSNAAWTMLPIPPRDLPWLMLRVSLQAGFYGLHLEGSKTRRLQGAFESWSLRDFEFGFLSSNHACSQPGPEAWTPGTVTPCESPGRGRGFTWERMTDTKTDIVSLRPPRSSRAVPSSQAMNLQASTGRLHHRFTRSSPLGASPELRPLSREWRA